MRSCMIFTIHQIYRWSNQGGNGQGVWYKRENCVHGFGGETWKKDTLEDLDGSIILKWILKKEYEKMNWIRLAQGDIEGTVIVKT